MKKTEREKQGLRVSRASRTTNLCYKVHYIGRQWGRIVQYSALCAWLLNYICSLTTHRFNATRGVGGGRKKKTTRKKKEEGLRVSRASRTTNLCCQVYHTGRQWGRLLQDCDPFVWTSVHNIAVSFKCLFLLMMLTQKFLLKFQGSDSHFICLLWLSRNENFSTTRRKRSKKMCRQIADIGKWNELGKYADFCLFALFFGRCKYVSGRARLLDTFLVNLQFRSRAWKHAIFASRLLCFAPLTLAQQ